MVAQRQLFHRCRLRFLFCDIDNLRIMDPQRRMTSKSIR
jgi:hypothetical protein